MHVPNSWYLMLIWLTLFTSSVYSTDRTDTLPFCDSSIKDRSLLFVSTLDGYFTALDARNGGLEEWNVSTGPGPMLSSSMHKLELSENSQWVRMIPSLTGGLYKFNGEYVQPIPVNADNLLGSSFQFSDDVIMSGGKEVRSYGLDIESGQVLYECSISKCDNFTETVNGSSDMILLQRDTRTVRAIEPRTGSERWNFSVAQHDVKLLHKPLPECNLVFTPAVDIDIKVIVPEGLIIAINKSDPYSIVWQHKFDSPIVSVWSLTGHQIQWIDLFAASYTNSLKNKIRMQPTVYVGMHNKQLYVQESIMLKDHLEKQSNGIVSNEDQFPKILWIPFPANEDRLMLKDDSSNSVLQLTDESTSTTAISVLYGSEYVNGNGYYLYDIRLQNTSGQSKICNNKNSNLNHSHDVSLPLISQVEEEMEIIPATITSLSHWWKEVLVISIATAFILNFICLQYINRFTCYIKELCGIGLIEEKSKSFSTTDGDSGIGSTTSHVGNENNFANVIYRSRYLDDFEPIHVLGKGGFGVVFQAKNKIDDCHYAIKRITLPNRQEARDRVMREVKALAKLEHRNIVRYFNAWQECPPVGWQEEQDKTWQDKSSKDFLSSAEETTKYDKAEQPIISTKNSFENEGEKSSKLFNFNIGRINKYLFSKNSSPDGSDSFVVFKSGTETDFPVNSISAYSKNESEEKCGNENEARIPRIYLYIQMQLCQKKSLREWLQDNPFRDRYPVLYMFQQIVQAVEYVHQQGLIHRDLKPSNIFFSSEGEIKIGDFGLVTAMANTEFSRETSVYKSEKDDRHTAHVGTELYMSPEQLDGYSYNYKVDIYSLGIILFELLIPFSTQMERYETLMNLRNDKYPLDFREKYSGEYNLLKTMLSSIPEERPSTCDIKSTLHTEYPDINIQPLTNNTNRFSNIPCYTCEINIET